MARMIDITDLTDAALDVFMRVKAGEDGVTVTHLSPAERWAVCQALEVKRIPLGWLHDDSGRDVCRGPAVHTPDYEWAILTEQDERFGE